MSAVDEVLFAPIDGSSNEPWRQQCRDMIAMLKQIRDKRNKRPAGAMLLEELLERFYFFNQKLFWVVDPVEGKFEFDFNGEVFLSDTGYCGLSAPDGEPAVEWNLVPNEENSLCYAFWSEPLARAYAKSIDAI